MPKVPTLSPEITPQATPQMPEASILRPPEGAFGGESAAATGRQGAAIEQTGDVVFQRMMEHREREMDQQNLDVQTKFQKALHDQLLNPELDDNGVPKGYLNRRLDQTKGATASFDQDAMRLKSQFMGMVGSPLQKQAMNRILSTHLLAARESIVSHEAQQGQASFDDSFQSNMKTTVGGAAGISDPAMLTKYISAAQLSAEAGWKHAGLPPDAADAAKKGYAAEIIKSALVPLSENDPKQAQRLLDGVKGQLTPEVAAELQNHVTGKKLDSTILDVFNQAKNYRMADGAIDRSKIDSYIQTLGLNPEQQLQVKTHVDRLAAVDYSELMRKRQDAERAFTNELISAQSKGIPYDQAVRDIPTKYGWDNTSVANMQSEVAKIYASPEEKWNSWISRQPQATQAAWAEAQNIVKVKYGNSSAEVAGVRQKLSDAALTELKQDLLGKSADQMREITKQKLDKVTVGPGMIWGNIWPNKNDAWKVDAETRVGLSAATAQLEKDYGLDRVGQARTYLATNNLPITPKNIKAALDKALGGRT